jgi:membrane protease YdiL (CAAX protease family)
VAGVLFGLVHSITFTYVVLATLMGVYLGWVWLYADHNLLVIVITHALYDFVVLLWLLRGPGAAEALEALQARQDAEKSQESPD